MRYFEDSSVKEYGVGGTLCSICKLNITSLLNYGLLNSTLRRLTGLEHGYVCLYCDNKLDRTQQDKETK